MALDPNEPAAFPFILQVERLYAALIACADAGSGLHGEPGLGGKLLYAGELDGDGRALLVAGNIAGAASLGATADAAAQKQAVWDGVADFLVTSLDEALRILKNEIRKREPVAVCVAAAPDAVEREMLERGVAPDLLRPADSFPEHSPFVSQGARRIELVAPEESHALLLWHVAAAPAIWMPRLDAIAFDCLSRDSSPAAWAARRWLRLAPRYLGRMAQGVRVLDCAPEAQREFAARVQAGVWGGQIGVKVWISLCNKDETFLIQPSPGAATEGAG